jgi:hypothetical protein
MTVLIGIDWNRSHTIGLELWRHLKVSNNCLLNFSLGVISHGIVPRGLDYYSDEKYGNFEKGYCFEKARPLIKSVVDACYITPDDGWWKAHNFIEMGIELYIYEKHPELLSLLRKSLANIVLIKKLCKELSFILGKDEDDLERIFAVFRKFVEEGPFDAQILAARYQKQIYFRYNIEAIDLGKCQSIIQKGKEMIVPDIDNFFRVVKEKMSPIWNVLREND